MTTRTGRIGQVLSPRPLATAIALALVASPAAAQYITSFEPPAYAGSPAGVDLTGQVGWTSPGTGPFRVYTSTSGALGFPPSPAGGSQFIAASATGDDFVVARHAVSFAGADVHDITVDFCFRYEGTLPASSFVGGLSAGIPFDWYAGWDNPSAPSSYTIYFIIADIFGDPIDGIMEPAGLLADHWYRQRIRIDFAAGRIVEIETRDLTSGGDPYLFTPVDWYLEPGPRPGRIDLVSLGYSAAGNQIAAFDNVTTSAPPPPPTSVLAFGLQHDALNGATLGFDVHGNLVVNSGAGPGAGEEDVSIKVGDGAGLNYAISPDDDLSELGQEVTCTTRGEVDGVPGTLITRSTIAGTGESALLTVDFPLAGAEGQRARLYDEQNRLIASVIVPNATPFTLTSPLRTTINTTRSSSKGGSIADTGGSGELIQPAHIEEFSADLEVTHPAAPGETWSKVRKIAIQAAARQGQPIRGVATNLGKKPVGSGAIIIRQEGPDLVVPGSAKGLAAISTRGQATLTAVPDAVVLTEPPGGGPALFSIADRGMPGELRRGKKRAALEMELPPTGVLADGAYLKTTANILLKGKQCPPNCFDVSVAETMVPGGPLPVEITADFTALGSTTHRVTVMLEGVVLGVHTGVGSVIGYAEEFTTARDIRPATPVTRGPLDPIKGISIGLIKKVPPPPVSSQIAGTTYTADEIRIEPEFPIETVEVIDDVSLTTQGLGAITITSATFEDAALLMGGLPVSLIGGEAELDLDTKGQIALTGIGGTGQDGYTIDLAVGMPGYATEVPRLPTGGASEGRYDLDLTTATVSMRVAPSGGGDDLSFQPIMVAGTYDLYAYKRRLKIFADDDRTGEAVVLAGGSRPVPMEQFIEEADGTTYAVVALSISDDTGAAIIDGQAIDADEVQIRVPLPSGGGAAIRKLDYRLSTDRVDAEHRAPQLVLGPGRVPIAGLGEAKLEPGAGFIAATGLTGTDQDGFVLKAVNEKGVQVYDAGWATPEPTAPAESSITATASFAGLLDPATLLAAKKRDRKRADSRFDVTADFTAIGSSTVHVEVLSGGVPVAQFPGHGPGIGIAGTAPIGAGAGTVWRLGGEGACVSSTYPAGTEFIIDGQMYIGDQLVLGAEGRAATDLLVSLAVTTVGYERLLIGEFTSEPLPICLADLNDDELVDFADYLEFLNLFDAQSPHVDFNQDGLVDFSDYLEFLNLYDAGC